MKPTLRAAAKPSEPLLRTGKSGSRKSSHSKQQTKKKDPEPFAGVLAQVAVASPLPARMKAAPAPAAAPAKSPVPSSTASAPRPGPLAPREPSQHAVRAEPPPFLLPAPAAPFETAAQVQPPPPLPPLLPAEAAQDATLRALLLPNVARLSLTTPEGQSLALRMQVKAGVAEVELRGDAAPHFRAREGELERMLATEGIVLKSVTRVDAPVSSAGVQHDAGSFHGSAQDHGRQRPDDAGAGNLSPPRTPPRPAPKTASAAVGVHVHA